jgi:hypothetical protein
MTPTLYENIVRSFEGPMSMGIGPACLWPQLKNKILFYEPNVTPSQAETMAKNIALEADRRYSITC